jgi:dihydropteroate synthase
VINAVQIMGVLNTTPDSFSDGGLFLTPSCALKQANNMHKNGANIIDIGGESSRPGANPVSLETELERVIPIIKMLVKTNNIHLSIDTTKPEVMHQALKAGASMVNDINALQTQGALEVASEFNANVCLMHKKGSVQTMQSNPTYNNIIDEIKLFFEKRIEACLRQGIDEHNIILDPGFGFGKTQAHNFEIFQKFEAFKVFNLKLLAGVSRKSMIGEALGGKAPNQRMIGSVMAAALLAQKGVDIVRVHDVCETYEALTLLKAVEK